MESPEGFMLLKPFDVKRHLINIYVNRTVILKRRTIPVWMRHLLFTPTSRLMSSALSNYVFQGVHGMTIWWLGPGKDG